MKLNSDFTKRAVVHSAQITWIRSPVPGVERRMLDRLGGEVARATTIVRYAPKSKFPPHVHNGGEEFFVLEGVFQDEYGDYPAGSYVRNPPNSRHTPRSDPGCIIFVKLWQFSTNDDVQVRIDTNTRPLEPSPDHSGIDLVPLFNFESENVRLETWAPGSKINLNASSGIEVLVLDGNFLERDELFTRQSWLRLPKTEGANIAVGKHGARVWIKRGHLAQPPTHPVTT